MVSGADREARSGGADALDGSTIRITLSVTDEDAMPCVMVLCAQQLAVDVALQRGSNVERASPQEAALAS